MTSLGRAEKSERSERSEKSGRSVARLEKLARSRKYDRLETEWMALVEKGELHLDDMLAALGLLHKRGHSDQLETLQWFLLSNYAEGHGAAEAMEVLLMVAPYIPTSAALRKEVVGIYRGTHADNDQIEGVMAMTVASGEIPLDVAIVKIEKLLLLQPGQYVYDRRERHAGRIIGVDAQAKRINVSFGDEEKRDYDAASLDYLDVVGDNDLRALKVFECERMREMAGSDPEALVRFILETFNGRIGFKELRGHVIDIIGSASAWSRWWKNARPICERSTVIQVTAERQPTFVLRRTPVSFEEQFRSRVRNAGSLAARLGVALDYLTSAKDGAETDPDLLRFLGEALQKDVDTGRDDSPGRMAAALVLVDDIRGLLSEPDEAASGDLRDLLSDAGSLPELVRTMGDESLLLRLLEFIRRELPEDWTELYAAALPECRTAVCEAIAYDLAEANGVVLAEAVEKVLARPSHSVGALIWIWRAACSGRLDEMPSPFPKIDLVGVLTSLVTVADAVKRNARGHSREEQKRLLGAIRNALALKEYRHAAGVVEGCEIERLHPLFEAIKRDVALSEQTRGMLHRVLQDHHPELYAEHVPLWEEDFIYSTIAGFEKRKEELRVLAHEKIPANAKAIGEAASKGDLSENAEWTAAIEERDRLTERASSIERELSLARFISDQAVASDHVTVGSGVRARNLQSGEMDTFTFLGPWDADIDGGILAYRSPLGLSFMGSKVGEEVMLDMGSGPRRWVIEEIR